MASYPVAQHTEAANRQHYEVPAAFFHQVLGARRKYSSCFYETSETTLDQAEIRGLELTVEHANLQDGQRILELGCGALVIPEQVAVQQAETAFDGMDNISDAHTANLFRAQLARLVDMVRVIG